MRNCAIRRNYTAFSVLLIHLEVTFVGLVFSFRVKPPKSTLHTWDPLACIMVAIFPNVLALTVPLVHIERSLIVAIFHNNSSLAMLIAINPVSLVEEASFGWYAVAEAVTLFCYLTPLPFVVVSSCYSSKGPERPLVQV